jgi:hypothetical protein
MYVLSRTVKPKVEFVEGVAGDAETFPLKLLQGVVVVVTGAAVVVVLAALAAIIAADAPGGSVPGIPAPVRYTP